MLTSLWWIKALKSDERSFIYEFRPPASQEELDELREILGIPVPQDLESFLLNSNGLYGDNNGWEFGIIYSIDDIKSRTENFRSSIVSPFPNLKNYVQIGYEPNRHCFSIYLFEDVHNENEKILSGVYNFSPLVESQNWDGYFDYIGKDLSEYFINWYHLKPSFDELKES
jgi:SMI1 / KNR4 family (SUKH-1)